MTTTFMALRDSSVMVRLRDVSGYSKEDRLNSREFRSTYGLKLQCAFSSRSQSELHAAHKGNSKGGTLASKAAAAS